MIKFLKWLFAWSGKSIDKKVCRELSCHIEKASKLKAKQKVIELDKIYHHTLKELGYDGSFGQILKKKPKEIRNLQEIWDLHKLRNTLVHDLRDIDERYVLKMGRKYEEVCEKFLRQIVKK